MRSRATKKVKATTGDHPGARSLSGILASDKGKGMSLAQIRQTLAKKVRARKGRW